MILALILQLLPVLGLVGLYYPNGIMAMVILVLFPFYHMDKNVSAVIFYATALALGVIAMTSDDFYPVMSLFAIAMVGWQLNQQRISQDTMASMVTKAKRLSMLSLATLVFIIGLYHIKFSLPIGWAMVLLVLTLGLFMAGLSITTKRARIRSEEGKRIN
ncbi:hypothetical protein [Motilimonas eburnea]|uniref:hypothetical protein n=1 Tax=Motilimonas eburnea TaxID=1737488 RepID=UPI001E4D9DD7|nr:hypothetical protein [Motilimonas eburnea]MCE2571970.1 hypothetical protein [Motilimonas eburnea]